MTLAKLIRRAFGVVAILCLLAPTAAHAADSPAQTVVRSFYAQLEETMKQGKELGFEGRYKKLDPVVRKAFNMPLMTRMSVGAGWASASKDEQDQVINAFSNFSVSTYASRFSSYDGETFAILGEKPINGGVIVETTLTPKDGEAVTLNYLMKQDEKGVYRIVDVFMNGMISELATRRAEFSSIVRREGIGVLVQSLTDKAKQLAKT